MITPLLSLFLLNCIYYFVQVLIKIFGKELQIFHVVSPSTYFYNKYDDFFQKEPKQRYTEKLFKKINFIETN